MCDDGIRASLAAKTLEKNHYKNIAVLMGGLNAWKEKSFNLVEGVNVPSKVFGEIIVLEQKG